MQRPEGKSDQHTKDGARMQPRMQKKDKQMQHVLHNLCRYIIYIAPQRNSRGDGCVTLFQVEYNTKLVHWENSLCFQLLWNCCRKRSQQTSGQPDVMSSKGGSNNLLWNQLKISKGLNQTQIAAINLRICYIC